MALRAHVDAAVAPVHEQLFAQVDLLLVDRARPPRADPARIAALQERLRGT